MELQAVVYNKPVLEHVYKRNSVASTHTDSHSLSVPVYRLHLYVYKNIKKMHPHRRTNKDFNTASFMGMSRVSIMLVFKGAFSTTSVGGCQVWGSMCWQGGLFCFATLRILLLMPSSFVTCEIWKLANIATIKLQGIHTSDQQRSSLADSIP